MLTSVYWQKNCLQFTYKGSACLADILESKWEVDNYPNSSPLTNVIHDFSKCTTIDALAAALIVEAKEIHSVLLHPNPEKVAIITEDIDFQYLLDKFHLHSPIELKIFATLNDAKNWLC
jgi:hypothetical protein